jgi:hypothetical protein
MLILKDARAGQGVKHTYGIPMLGLSHVGCATFMPGNVIQHPKPDRVVQRRNGFRGEALLQAALPIAKMQPGADQRCARIAHFGDVDPIVVEHGNSFWLGVISSRKELVQLVLVAGEAPALCHLSMVVDAQNMRAAQLHSFAFALAFQIYSRNDITAIDHHIVNFETPACERRHAGWH